MIHRSISENNSSNPIQIHANYNKTYIKNIGQYGLENQNNSFTLAIDHNSRSLEIDSIHNSKQYILDLVSQAWKNDKFDIETGKFSAGYPQSSSYNLCDQKLSVVFKFAKDQYSRKEDSRDIYSPNSIITSNIANQICSENCAAPVINNISLHEILSDSFDIILDVQNNTNCCCSAQYSLNDTNTWLDIPAELIECEESSYNIPFSFIKDIIP